MNIGIYLGNIDEKIGGGFTFQDSILEGLKSYESKDNIFVFWYGKEVSSPIKNINFINIQKTLTDNILSKITRKYKKLFKKGLKTSKLTQLSELYKIDLFWFPTPNFESVSVPYIYTVWDLNHRINPYFPEIHNEWDERERIYQSILPKASYIVTGTEEGKEEISFYYKIHPERIKIINFPLPKSCSPKTADSHKDFKEFKPYLYYPAQFWAHKNHVQILKAIAFLKNHHNTKVNAIFTGHDYGNSHYLKSLCKQYSIEDQIHFLGFVSIEEKNQIYKNALALVYPSYFGPDNLPPLEAFYFKCPVICGLYKGAKQQLKENALYFELNDYKSLAEHILTIKDNVSIRDDLVSRAFKFVENMSPKNYVESAFRIIDELKDIRSCWSYSGYEILSR